MPTLRHRFTITETDEVGRALDDAALLWPDDRHDRGALLRHLVQRGSESVRGAAEHLRSERKAAIRAAAGSLDGVYPENARRELLEDWPE